MFPLIFSRMSVCQAHPFHQYFYLGSFILGEGFEYGIEYPAHATNCE